MLLLLEVGEAAGLGVDVLDLALGVGVEADELLARGAAGGLLEVGPQAGEERVRPRRQAVALVRRLGPVRRVVLGVQPLQRVAEPVRHPVLVVQLDGPHQRRVPHHVPVRQVLGQDPAARLLLLRDLVRVAVGIRRRRGRLMLRGRGTTVGRGHADLDAAELGVVEELGRLGCCRLLEGHAGVLGLLVAGAGARRHLDVGDLAAEAEEIFDLLVFGCGGDALHVDCVGRHDDVVWSDVMWCGVVWCAVVVV